MGKELRESRLLASSCRGRVFTQFLSQKFTTLSKSYRLVLEIAWCRNQLTLAFRGFTKSYDADRIQRVP